MDKIKRSRFIKLSALGLAASILPSNIWSNNYLFEPGADNNMLQRLIEYNDKTVTRFFAENSNKTKSEYLSSRRESVVFAIIAASYCSEDSIHYKKNAALNRLEEIISSLIAAQYPDGTIDSGGNRQSPPDTAFLLEHICPAASVLNELETKETENLKLKLKKFLLKVGEGLLTGGIHTPNHRWVVSASLARLYKLYGDERYVKRIDEWLAEGIFIDEDGQFPERSRNYALVEDRSLLTIGHILNRPQLFDIVRKNLISTYYFMEENGELITLDSRRQDQNYLLSITKYYLFYRYLAIYFNDKMLAAIASKIENLKNFENEILSRSLIDFLHSPILFKEIPEKAILPDNYIKEFPHTNLVRIKRGEKTATIFGGNDRPIIIASGRSSNPSFFTFRKGNAIIEYARLSTSFFRTGYFRSEGLIKDGNVYKLHEKKEAYYYQPMEAGNRKPDGDYILSESADGRYWSKMDFESRKKSNIQQLVTNISIREDNGTFEMQIEVTGPERVEVVLELCFREGGDFNNVISANNNEDYFMNDGYCTYEVGNDIIRIGPGKSDHKNIRNIDGELYSTHFGTIKGKGKHLYLTAFTPFNHKLVVT